MDSVLLDLWNAAARKRGIWFIVSRLPHRNPSTPPPPTSSHLLNRQRGMCKVRWMAGPRGSDCECSRLYFFREWPLPVCLVVTKQNILLLFSSPPLSFQSGANIWFDRTINPCVLGSLLSYLSFKILQLSILLRWQRLLIIRSGIRLARALCMALWMTNGPCIH